MKVFALAKPYDDQIASYSSRLFFHGTSGPITIEWVFSGTMPTGAQARLTVNGNPVTGWLSSPFTTTLDLPDGEHLLGAETNQPDYTVLEVPIRVMKTPTSQAPEHLWIVPTHTDFEYKLAGPGAYKLPYPTETPFVVGRPTPSRTIERYNTYIAPSGLWVSRTAFSQIKFSRRIHKTRMKIGTQKVDVLTGHADRTVMGSDGSEAVRTTQSMPLLDGPRGVATQGFVSDVRIHPDAQEWYGLSANGRLWARGWSGDTETILGWRNKADEYPRDWRIGSKTWGGTDYDPAWYQEGFEQVGVWASGTPGLSDPSGFWVKWGETRAQDVIYIADTKKHRILCVEQRNGVWTATRIAGDEQPGVLNLPHGLDLGPDGRLYCTQRGNGSIVAIDITTGAVEVLFTTAAYPPGPLTGAAQSLRVAHSLDGPFGTAKIARPGALRFMSTGEAIVLGNYTADIRKVNFTTKTVLTVASHAFTQANVESMFLAVDKHGECGPVDDIFVTNYYPAATDGRYAKDGTKRGHMLGLVAKGPLQEGPLASCRDGSYFTGLDVRAGLILMTDYVADSSYAITKKQPTDLVPDIAKYNAGLQAWTTGARPSLALSHGQYGQGQFGLPTWDEMSFWTNDVIDRYLMAWGLSAAQAEAVRYCIRWNVQSFDEPNQTPTTVTRMVSAGVTVEVK